MPLMSNVRRRAVRPRALFAVLLWGVVGYTVWVFLGNYGAPEGCLDVLHGSFDYKTWKCSLEENKPYVHTPIYRVPGFLPLALSFVCAAVVTAIGVGRRPATVSP